MLFKHICFHRKSILIVYFSVYNIALYIKQHCKKNKSGYRVDSFVINE